MLYEDSPGYTKCVKIILCYLFGAKMVFSEVLNWTFYWSWQYFGYLKLQFGNIIFSKGEASLQLSRTSKTKPFTVPFFFKWNAPYFGSIEVGGYIVICVCKIFSKSTNNNFFVQSLFRPMVSTKSVHTDFVVYKKMAP